MTRRELLERAAACEDITNDNRRPCGRRLDEAPAELRKGYRMKRKAALVFLVAILAASSVIATASAREPGDTPAARRATRALDILEAHGYAAGLENKSFGAFQDFRPAGKNYAATIEQNGRSFVVIVDPDTGEVTPQR